MIMPTQKPVPSNDIKDLLFNSGLLDEWATSVENEYIDRFGNGHLTAAGMEWAFKQLVEKFNIDMDAAIRAAGYVLLDSFQQGVKLPNNEITLRNQALRDERTGEYYRWNGDLPKQVLPGSTPESTGGIGVVAWVSVGDASLKFMLSSTSGASAVGTESGKTVQDDLDDINVNVGEIVNDYIPELALDNAASIKTSVQTLDKIKDESLSYDAFGNSVFYNGRNLLCFRRSAEHIDNDTDLHSVCIAEIYSNGSYKVIWKYDGVMSQEPKDPTLSVTNPGNQLILSFQLHDVINDTYTKGVIGFPDLGNSGVFSSKSDLNTSYDVFLWGNVLQSPAGSFITTRYKIDGTGVEIITSSDANLNGSTTWEITSTLSVTSFPLRTLVSESSLSYYRNQLVAFVRTQSGESLAGFGYAKTSDLTGATGWQYFTTSVAYAAPRSEPYTDYDDPLVVSGTTARTITPKYRSDVSITATYDLSTFSTSQVVFSGDYFNVYASSKKVSDGIYEIISFDEDLLIKNKTNIHRLYFYLNQMAKPKSYARQKNDWSQTIINGRPCYGNLAIVNNTQSSSSIYFSFSERVGGITRLMIIIGAQATAVTLSPIIYAPDGSVFANCYNVSVAVSTSPQILELTPVSTPLDFNIFGRFRISLGTPLLIGCAAGSSGSRLPLSSRLPFNLYNVGGNTTSPYAVLALAKL